MRIEEYQIYNEKIEDELHSIFAAYAHECDKKDLKPACINIQTRNPEEEEDIESEYDSEYITTKYNDRRYTFVLYNDKDEAIGYIEYLKNLNHLAVIELRSVLIHPKKKEKGAGTYLIVETMKMLKEKHILGDCMIIQVVHKLRHISNERKNVKTNLLDYYQKVFNDKLVPIKKTRRLPIEQYYKIFFL
jgi:GNAT superfamily N-acetyltransferase